MVVATGCSAPRPVTPGPGSCQLAPITYYADHFAGRPTASGEIYDPRRRTAAHRSLPMNSRLRVSWQGKSVQVRVNDRGGPRGGVDLSRGAAEELGMIRAGRITAEVCVE
jgi:rare lipoprotein A